MQYDDIHLDLHYVPRSRDAICLRISDVARQRRSVVLVSYLILQRRLGLPKYLSRKHAHTTPLGSHLRSGVPNAV